MSSPTRHTLRNRLEGFIAGVYAYLYGPADTASRPSRADRQADRQLVKDVINRLNALPLEFVNGREYHSVPGCVLMAHNDIRDRQLINISQRGRRVATIARGDLGLYAVVKETPVV